MPSKWFTSISGKLNQDKIIRRKVYSCHGRLDIFFTTQYLCTKFSSDYLVLTLSFKKFIICVSFKLPTTLNCVGLLETWAWEWVTASDIEIKKFLYALEHKKRFTSPTQRTKTKLLSMRSEKNYVEFPTLLVDRYQLQRWLAPFLFYTLYLIILRHSNEVDKVV